MDVQRSISAVLFYQAEPILIKRLATLLKLSEEEIQSALPELSEKLSAIGLRLLQNGNEVTLGTAPESSELIEQITKEELSRDLSKAALETLAIVLYKCPVTRSEIDYIRGVNSTFILRNLLIRGLVEKIDNPKDQRSFLYKPTFQLLEYMGVATTEELPSYHDALAQLGAFMQNAPTTDDKHVEGKDAETSNGEGDAEKVFEEMERNEQESIIDADISEEDTAGAGFDDAELRTHTATDRNDQPL